MHVNYKTHVQQIPNFSLQLVGFVSHQYYYNVLIVAAVVVVETMQMKRLKFYGFMEDREGYST